MTTAEYAVHGLIYLRLPGAASRIIHGNSLPNRRSIVIVFLFVIVLLLFLPSCFSTGQFSGGPKEVMCAQERTLGRLDCYVTNPANDALWWWWYQVSSLSFSFLSHL